MSQLHMLADLLDSCEPEDDAPVTWGSLRRQVREAADRAVAQIRDVCAAGNDHESVYMTEDDGRTHWRCLRCGVITEEACS